MNKPHKHAALIKAWADGAKIQVRLVTTAPWVTIPNPNWHEDIEYRVKPEPKPDIVRYIKAYYDAFHGLQLRHVPDDAANIKLVFDGETHKLKSVELINKE